MVEGLLLDYRLDHKSRYLRCRDVYCLRPTNKSLLPKPCVYRCVEASIFIYLLKNVNKTSFFLDNDLLSFYIYQLHFHNSYNQVDSIKSLSKTPI